MTPTGRTILTSKTEADLIKRCEQETLIELPNIEASIDDQPIEHLENYRVGDPRFLTWYSPKENVYNVKPGLTRSVCDGYWLFIKPL